MEMIKTKLMQLQELTNHQNHHSSDEEYDDSFLPTKQVIRKKNKISKEKRKMINQSKRKNRRKK